MFERNNMSIENLTEQAAVQSPGPQFDDQPAASSYPDHRPLADNCDIFAASLAHRCTLKKIDSKHVRENIN